jgi:hypothetical protein
MNELVNFARQELFRLSDQEGNQTSVPSPSAERQVPDWLTHWRELARQTAGLSPDDPRMGPVLSTLAEAERAHKAGDAEGFQRAAIQAHRLMQFIPGARVRWQATVNSRLALLGPATVVHVHEDLGRLWVWVSWQGAGRWVHESIITTIEWPTR